MKAVIFPGELITVEGGKIYAVRISSKMGCEGVRCHLCLTHYYQAVLVWCFEASQSNSIWSPRNWYALKLGKKYFIKETYAIMRSMRGFGLKNINFRVFSLGQEVPKTIFIAAEAKVAS